MTTMAIQREGVLGNTDTSGSPQHLSEAQLGHLTLIAFNRALTQWSSRGALEESEGAVLCASGTWIPVVANGAFRADETLGGAALIAKADTFFKGLGRGYTVKVRDSGEDDDVRHACLQAELELFGDPVPEMLCRAPLPEPAPIDGVTVGVVADEAGVRDFIAVNSEAYATYGMPADVHGDLFDEVDRVLTDTAASIVVAHRDGQAIATAMAYESDGVASIQWVGTVPAARAVGLGALVTVASTNLAFAHGASSVSLQASPMGESVYRKLGYETIYHYTEYVRWPKPPAR
jgi:hypothetical protein